MNTQVEEIRRRKRKGLIALGVFLLVVVLTAIETLVQELRSPSNINDNIRVFTLLNINLIIVMGLILLVFRQLIKLYLERRQNILGSKFKAKLIFAFVGLSLVPAVLLFLVSSNLISTTVDSWFNTQNEESLRKALVVAQTYYQDTLGKAFAAAEEISRLITQNQLLDADNFTLLRLLIAKKQAEANLGMLRIVAANGEELLSLPNPRIPQSRFIADIRPLLKKGFSGREFSIVRSTEDGDLIDGVVPIRSSWNAEDVVGVVVFNYYDPHSLMQEINEIREAYEEYKRRKVYKAPLKSIYTMVVLVATMIIIFSAIWIGFQLARGITVPFQKLVEGTREVASGNLDYRVEVKADDEIKILVDSFNQMTSDLRQNKQELEERKNYIETVLEQIATGVVTLDRKDRVATLNQAAAKMLGLRIQEAVGRRYTVVFSGEQFEPLRRLIDKLRSRRIERYRREMRLRLGHSFSTLLVAATVLQDSSQGYLGLVLVLDDLTQLIKAQKAAAWREVAQRIAHEIKNPLTPIQLCTQRLRRKCATGGAPQAQLVDECTATILREVESLKGLVDEFSRFARMPAVQLRPEDVNTVVRNSIALYNGQARGIQIVPQLAEGLPRVNLDAEQLRRALVNLLDNAIYATAENGGSIQVRTSYHPKLQVVRIEVADQGVGISPEDKERLFLPYFSTKKGGTGLGLAIVNRIVTDHQGSIRVEDNYPRGTRFIIDLPV